MSNLLCQTEKSVLLKKLKEGIVVNIGSFIYKISIDNQQAALDFINNYADFEWLSDNQFIDFNIVIKSPNVIRRFFKPQINFYCNGKAPFIPLPINQGYAMLEWGMNWCVVSQAHHFFILHAAVVERNGKAIILPGIPGAGKSTLSASLVNNGWRLLSDEMTLISLKTGLIQPVARPINLKNDSIDILKKRHPDSVFSQKAHDTHKGTVSLMKPPKESVFATQQTAKAHFIIFPEYRNNSGLKVESIEKSTALMSLIDNSFNYNVLGKVGFEAATLLLKATDCKQFSYSNIDDAVSYFNDLVDT